MPLIYLLKMLHCPVCNSTEVWAITGGYTGRIYQCKRCGYRGALVIEYNEEGEERDGR